MAGEALVAKLRELRYELDRMGVNLFGAEHVPPQVLYHLLVSDLLRQEREDIPVPPGGAWIIDVSRRFEDLACECPV